MRSEAIPAAPSRLWSVAAVLSFVLAVLLVGAAAADQYRSTRLVGEGELFLRDARTTAVDLAAALEDGEPAELAVRRIRNALGVEAVGIVDREGRIVAATSPNLEGERVDAFLRENLLEGRFGAIAVPLQEEILLDGVREWMPGDVLYQVVHPFEVHPGGLLLMYDLSELLGRRAQTSGVRPLTLGLAGAGLVMAVAGSLLLMGRAGARRRIDQARLERRFLEERSVQLERHNRELEEARHQAEQALALAEETNRIRSEFVLMINHELRTPLTSVVTGAELLLEDRLEGEEARSVLADMVRDGRRLKDLISQMLLVARIENRGLTYVLEELGIQAVRSRLEAASRRVGLWDDSPELDIRTDPEALSHLLLSLADNALTHGASRVRLEMVEGLPFEPMLTVGRPPRSAVYFLVRDDGPGIDPEFLPRAFEKFEKRGSGSGTGLGLYLARLMVEGIEGCIAVRTGSEGTTMAVGVPAVPAVSPAEVGR